MLQVNNIWNDFSSKSGVISKVIFRIIMWFDRKNLKEDFSSASDQVRSRKGQRNKRKLTEKPFTFNLPEYAYH